jgi:hypothetical protein
MKRLSLWFGTCALLVIPRSIAVAGHEPLPSAPAQNVAPAAESSASNAPHFSNARLTTRSLTGSLTAEIKNWAGQDAAARWIGYAVPQMAGDRQMCCADQDRSWNGRWCSTCRLEGRDRGDFTIRSDDVTAKLEASHNMAVLLRAEDKRVMKIRIVSADCSVDAGGLPVVWLTGVKPAESVDLLAGYVTGADVADHDDGRGVDDGALAALALHADAAADRALESFVQPERPEHLRKQAAFWLGEARKAGLATLQKMAKSDPSAEVRAQVAFALSVSREPQAVDEMIRMAKEDQSGHVRGQALFWLAQKAGRKAEGAITAAIENDPDTEVKKKAVFALSQLPKDEGVPKLIEVAQSNHNPAVRKQAMFWLGQSNDPRALAFFEKVLTQ